MKNPGSVPVVLFLSTNYELKQNINLKSIESQDHLFPCGQSDVFCFAGECGEDLAGTSGFLTSPNFPNNFPRNTDCISTITVPAGFIIKLTFLNFTLEPNEQTDCAGSLGGARVFITNVASDDGAPAFKLCGQNIPSPVFSVGNFIQVRLLSLNNVFSGFKAFYEAISADDGKLTQLINNYSETCCKWTLLGYSLLSASYRVSALNTSKYTVQ